MNLKYSTSILFKIKNFIPELDVMNYKNFNMSIS